MVPTSLYILPGLLLFTHVLADPEFPFNGRSFDVSKNWKICDRQIDDVYPDAGIRDFGIVLSEKLKAISELGGGTVRLRDGIYTLRTAVVVQTGTCVVGQSMQGVVFRVPMVANSVGGKGVIRANRVHSVTLRKFSIDVNGRQQLNTTSGLHLARYGVYFTGVDYAWIENVLVFDSLAYGFDVHGLPGNHANHLALEHVVADGASKDGIKVSHYSQAILRNVMSLRAGRFGVHISSGENVSVSQSLAASIVSDDWNDSGCGIAVRDRDGIGASHIYLSHNRVHDAQRVGVCIRKSNTVTVSTTKITGNPSACIETYRTTRFINNANICSVEHETVPHCSGVSLLKDEVCCPHECGICGGMGCGKREPKGKCCASTIRAENRSCTTHAPPCTLL